jgi:hypothetical protein
MGRRGIATAALVVVLLAAGCGAADDAAIDAGSGISAGSPKLEDAPFPLGPDAQLVGTGPDTLFVVDRRDAAFYDFVGGGWSLLPKLPFEAAGITSVGSTLIALGPDCGDPCDPDQPVAILGAALDLGAEDPGWHQEKLQLPIQAPKFFRLLRVGQIGDEQVLALRKFFAIKSDLSTRELAMPEGMPTPYPWYTCAVHGGLQALVPDTAVAPNPADPYGWAFLGPRGNGLLTQTKGAVDSPWSSIPGSETRDVSVSYAAMAEPDNVSLNAVLSAACTEDGMLLATNDETVQWTGGGWEVHPGGPAEAVPQVNAVTTTSDTVASPGIEGSIILYQGGRWSTVPIETGFPADQSPPLLSVAAVGDRVVVMAIARSIDPEIGVLQVVGQ